MYRRHQIGARASIVLGVITIAFGFWGWKLLEPELGFFDTLYRAIQLFAIDNFGEVNSPWQLEVARFTGVLAVATAIVSFFLKLVSVSFDRLVIRLFAHDHHLIVGSDSRAVDMARGLIDSGRRVVVIEPPSSEESEGAFQISDLHVIVGDPRDRWAYRWARQSRARHVFFSLGDDSLNLLAMEASLAEETDGQPGRSDRSHLTRHVAIDNPRLWARLHQASLTWSGGGAAIQFVSVPDLVAAFLVDEAGPGLADGRILICGAGPAAERTAVRAARVALLEERRPNLKLGGPSAQELLAALSRNEPWLVTGESADVSLGTDTVEPEVAFIVGLSYEETLATAAELVDDNPELDVVAEVPLTENAEALRRSGFPVDRMRLVVAEAEIMGSRAFELSPREEIARARHEHYLEMELSKGLTVNDNPSLVAWEDLPPALRDSNRMFADSIGKRLEDLGARLAPLTGPVPKPLDDTIVEDLARVEHERWMTDLISDGWQPTEGSKDPVQKLHPLLIPFDDLSPEEQAKDEDSIERLPDALARVGYEIRIES